MSPDKASSDDLLSQQLGLESLRSFSLREFLSGTFASYPWSEYEQRLSAGAIDTTPPLNQDMAQFPKPWLFVRILAGTTLAYLVSLLLLSVYKMGAIIVLPALIFYGCFAIPFSVLTFFFEMNTPRNVSMIFLMRMLVVGGAISFLVTFILFDYFPLQKLYGAAAAGFVEEMAKVLVVIFFARQFIGSRHPFTLNGILYGATVGTGFAAFESAGYALHVGLIENSFSSLNHVIVLRGVLAPFMHIPWTAIGGGALWLAYRKCQTIPQAVFSIKFASLFVLPIALHFCWNYDFHEYLGLPELIDNLKIPVLGIISWLIVMRLVATGLKEISQETGNIRATHTC